MRTDRRPLRVAGFWLIAVLAALPFVFPLWWMITSSLKPAGEVFAATPQLLPLHPRWFNYVEVFRHGPFARQYLNSIYIAALNVLGTLLVASLAGYAFARIRFPGRMPIFVVLLTALFLPAEVTIIPLFKLMTALGLIDTHIPLIVPPIFGPPAVFGIFLMRQAFLALPRDLEDAGRIDGLGQFGLFRHIMMPLVRPPLATLAILTFLSSWNAFLEPLVYLDSTEKFTLPIALTQYVDSAGGALWNVQLAAATLSVLPIAIVFLFLQRYFVAGVANVGIKG